VGAGERTDLKGVTAGVQPAPNVEPILLLVAQTPRIPMNSHSSPRLEKQCAFAVLDRDLSALHHGGHPAGQEARRPAVPQDVCQP